MVGGYALEEGGSVLLLLLLYKMCLLTACMDIECFVTVSISFYIFTAASHFQHVYTYSIIKL